QIWFHRGPVNSVQWSPDGRRVITAGDDGTAQVWDILTGKPVTLPLRHAGKVTLAAFSPDGRRVVTASADHTARLWDAATGKPVGRPMDHSTGRVVFSPDSRLLVGNSTVWDVATGQRVVYLNGHTSDVTTACFTPDGRRVVTGSADQTARFWDVLTGRPLL